MMPIRFALAALAVATLAPAGAPAAVDNAERTRKLAAVLQSDAPFYDKARACQQLGEFGDEQAVPALAALLADEHLNAYARSGLEGIPDPSAAEALRNAAAALKGNQLAGAVNSLGVLRDAKAVGLLDKLAADPASGVSGEALLALGRIANAESIAILGKALRSGAPDAIRANAAAGCLLAAEKQRADGRTKAAIALYDRVRKADIPTVIRAAATRGAIVARKKDGVPLLVETLRSPDRILANVALQAVREIPCDALAKALNAEIGPAEAEWQVLLIAALADCHNAKSLEFLRARLDSGDPGVRKAAIEVLGRIGGPADADALVRTLAANRSEEEAALALDSLGRLEGAGVDKQIIKSLAGSSDAALRVRLIKLLENRGAPAATKELLKQAADSDAGVGAAALRALKSLAVPGDVPALVELIKTRKDASVRKAAEAAVAGVCGRAGDPVSASEPVFNELVKATDPADRKSWIGILAPVGSAKALPVILAATKDADESVAAHAVEQLGRWPDPAPVDALFELAQAGGRPALQARALSSAIRLATAAAEQQQRPGEVLAGWFARAGAAAKTKEDQWRIISGLGRVKHAESLRLLSTRLDDPDLRKEAALAIVQIAPSLPPSSSDLLREALEKIAAAEQNADVKAQAARLLAALPASAKRISLFDGKTLAGWEGNTNVWRVRDGAIVGGSLQGNPRNEFLATARRYTNVVLRFEYKLVGAEGFVNGGVQFRSVRTERPPNEMSGYQADIGAGHSGCLYDESRRNKFLARATDEQIKRLEKPGDWNCCEVRCEGPRIRIALNGEKTVDYTEADAAIPPDGLIALQIHGNCKAEISFRNIGIEDLGP